MNQPNDEAITHLTALAERLDDADLLIEHAFGQRPPQLSIKNTNMRDGRGWELLSGAVQVVVDRGKSWFAWDDGDRITRTEFVDVAAERVTRALTVPKLV
ncbi:hypothetical protein [Actinomadura geliboluensis]|uniref:Uncharacterized protein n=1 Tax=Actinomadura geliboluensis TaxID=882440 RepID=A0A5S4G457_9ACTN|nr:hypothetical protein [Actinomadura geliboluensis]TMR27797.1 hypothetical protein ETD96_38720 [Actinomadura geliboluensis]